MRSIALPLVLAALAGCAAPVGDFGRRDRGVYADAMTEIAGPFAPATTGVERAAFHMTDEERELRHLGWGLVKPPDRDVPGNSLAEFRWWRALPDGWYASYPQAYWSALVVLPVESHETRYQRIIIQARADAQRMPAFRDAASRVGLADGARLQALTSLAVDPTLRREAEQRVAENRAVVATVCRALAKRIRAYRYANHRLMVETPSTRSVETEAAIDALAWEAGDCGGAIRAVQGGVIEGLPRDRFLPRGDGPAAIPK
jgi:hypothetical protein